MTAYIPRTLRVFECWAHESPPCTLNEHIAAILKQHAGPHDTAEIVGCRADGVILLAIGEPQQTTIDGEITTWVAES